MFQHKFRYKTIILILLPLLVAATSSPVASAISPVKKSNDHHPSPHLVPPPPPFVPLLGRYYIDSRILNGNSNLKLKQKELEDLLKIARKNLEDQKRKLTERQERSKQLEPLYTEGVVSRHELETAKDDISQSQIDFATAEQRVDELEQEALQFKAAAKIESPSHSTSSKKHKH